MQNRTPDVGSPGAWYQLVRSGERGRIAVGGAHTEIGLDPFPRNLGDFVRQLGTFPPIRSRLNWSRAAFGLLN